MLLVLLVVAVATAASDPWPDQEDDCYIMESSCHISEFAWAVLSSTLRPLKISSEYLWTGKTKKLNMPQIYLRELLKKTRLFIHLWWISGGSLTVDKDGGGMPGGG